MLVESTMLFCLELKLGKNLMYDLDETSTFVIENLKKLSEWQISLLQNFDIMILLSNFNVAMRGGEGRCNFPSQSDNADFPFQYQTNLKKCT